MLPLAHIQDELQYLKVSNTPSVNAEENVSEDSRGSADQERFNSMFNEVSPLYYNGRARLSLEVREEYKADFILIRGLIEFQRPKELAFTYDLKQRTVQVDIPARNVAQLNSFMAWVFVSLRQEKQFRKALKTALDFEQRYNLERESVYGILKSSSPAMRPDTR